MPSISETSGRYQLHAIDPGIISCMYSYQSHTSPCLQSHSYISHAQKSRPLSNDLACDPANNDSASKDPASKDSTRLSTSELIEPTEALSNPPGYYRAHWGYIEVFLLEPAKASGLYIKPCDTVGRCQALRYRRHMFVKPYDSVGIYVESCDFVGKCWLAESPTSSFKYDGLRKIAHKLHIWYPGSDV